MDFGFELCGTVTVTYFHFFTFIRKKFLQLEANLKLSQLSVASDKTPVPFHIILLPTYKRYRTHRPSTIKNDPDHGENWLPTTLNNTVTRRILTFLAMVFFIPWPLGSYRYLTCHHQPDIEKNLQTEVKRTVHAPFLWPKHAITHGQHPSPSLLLP